MALYGTTYHPIIGIVPTQMPDENIERVSFKYIDAIVDAGGAPLILPLTLNPHIYETLFPYIDGFILSGGQDISPHLYGGTEGDGKVQETTPTRDSIERLVLSYICNYDIPTLGVCRGMQMINVFFGGTLYEDIVSETPETFQDLDEPLPHLQREDFGHTVHHVHIDPASQLGRIMEVDKAEVNSIHHQGIKDLAPDLQACAWSPDGLVEGIEFTERTFLLGVQWHPEWLTDQSCMRRIFEALIHHAMLARQNARPTSGELHFEDNPATMAWTTLRYNDGF